MNVYFLLIRSLVLISSVLSFLSISVALNCSRVPHSIPAPERPIGSPDSNIPLEHIIVLMQENHSFDTHFGALSRPEFYGKSIDGLRAEMSNPDQNGHAVYVYHETNLCPPNPKHDWNSMHVAWNGGRNNGFLVNNKSTVLGAYDDTDIPYYYSLANQFAVADRFFCSVLGPTFPNRFFLITGTAFGHIRNDFPAPGLQYSQRSLFNVLNENGITWKYYKEGKGFLALFGPLYLHNQSRIRPVAEFEKDLKSGNLPHVVFIDSSREESEHPGGSVQIGQNFVGRQIQALVRSSYWKDSVLFLTYDEGGGFFDHVSPPEACIPDNIPPKLRKNSFVAKYDHYGFRVPFVAVSPYAKHHYVSHRVYDHTSILKFIETKYNLPALTYRDANADNLLDLFDFNNPILAVRLPPAEVDPNRSCAKGKVITEEEH